jgi:sugar lactone lactonase YvrE
MNWMRYTLPLLALCLICSATLISCGGGSTQLSGNIYNFAGNTIGDYSGDGSLAISSELAYPTKVVVDGSGNVFIADANNGVIRKVTASTRKISTIAGIGSTIGFTPEGGTALDIALSGLNGLAIDASGNIYFCDAGDNVVERYDATALTISVIAGTGTAGFTGDGAAATAAELSAPTGVAVDKSGNVYIADSGNNRVRKIAVSTGIISTVAGTGNAGYSGDGAAATSATLSIPYDLAFDSSYNLYVADLGNAAVRKIAVSTGIISTVAGTGTAGYTGDGSAATSATLSGPKGLSFDSSDNLYICDLSNSVVRKVSASTGVISTIAGNGTRGYSGNGGQATKAKLFNPTGVAINSAGYIYIADSGNNVVRVIYP